MNVTRLLKGTVHWMQILEICWFIFFFKNMYTINRYLMKYVSVFNIYSIISDTCMYYKCVCFSVICSTKYFMFMFKGRRELYLLGLILLLYWVVWASQQFLRWQNTHNYHIISYLFVSTIELLQNRKYFGFSQLILEYKQTFTVKILWYCTY